MIARPQKEKGKVANQEGNTGQNAKEPSTMIPAPAKVTGDIGPDKRDNYPDQKLLWGRFKEAITKVPEEELEEY